MQSNGNKLSCEYEYSSQIVSHNIKYYEHVDERGRLTEKIIIY